MCEIQVMTICVTTVNIPFNSRSDNDSKGVGGRTDAEGETEHVTLFKLNPFSNLFCADELLFQS